MASVHVLEVTGLGATLVLHIPIPATNNTAGVAWRTALTRSKIGGTTVLPDGDGTGGTISAAEKLDITNGVIYEFVNAYKRVQTTNAALDALFASERPRILAGLQDRLQFYGYTRP